MQGLILLNKPSGITSFGAVARIKRLAGEKRVGHTGTLDPMATGVLPVFIGRATVLSSHLLDADKTYTATVRLGLETDTLDITGEVTEQREIKTDNNAVLETLNSFLGKQKQVPPMYSALKKDGVRLYDIARNGETVEIEPRDIEVISITELSPLGADNEFSFSVTVSKGTYIRSLVRDFGRKLGTLATLTALERTETAGFKIDSCVDLDSLTEENIANYVVSADTALPHIEKIGVTEKQATRFCNGGQLDLDRLKNVNKMDGMLYRVYSNGNFLGLGIVDAKNNQLAIKCIV